MVFVILVWKLWASQTNEKVESNNLFEISLFIFYIKTSARCNLDNKHGWTFRKYGTYWVLLLPTILYTLKNPEAGMQMDGNPRVYYLKMRLDRVLILNQCSVDSLGKLVCVILVNGSDGCC